MIARTHHALCAGASGGLCTGCYPTVKTTSTESLPTLRLSCLACRSELVAIGATEEIARRAANEGCGCEGGAA